MTDFSEIQLQIRSALLSQPLTDSDIHVWCASLNVFPQDLPHYLALLSQAEHSRAERLYFERDRNRFIVGRGLLRLFLGIYSEQEPAQIEFVYGPQGKPAIKSEGQNKVLEFNLSHSKDIVLYAFNWNRKLGIDVEYIIPMADSRDFAEKYFTPRESGYINSLSGKQKEQAFFKTWTCKEAFLKANGSGLMVPISQVEISLRIEGVVKLISIDGSESASYWRLELLNLLPQYQAALAVEDYHGRIIFQYLNTHPAA
jgi:4'-phosphopantetheinyl transferase